MATNQLNKIPAAANVIVAATEVAVFQAPASLAGSGSAGTWISGDLQVVPGTGTTAMTIRCRYGSGITGATVDANIVVPVSAGVTNSIAFNFFDTTNANEQAGGVIYTLTAQQTGGSANGSVNSGHMGIEV